MKIDVKKLYKHMDFFERYGMESKERIKEIEKIYSSNKKFFGNNILDIGCGGGILGFTIELYGKKYTGVDVNSDMIKQCRNYAKRIDSKNKFMKGYFLCPESA